jgi:hypothetical protein
MGDDTWTSVFPDSFHENMSFPYDSFNVEDLHSVDNGVIENLFPLLEDPTKPFDFLVGHFLGVDHVGHRVGPDHPSMKDKLQQMNRVLKRVVELLDSDTLLVVLGDHGMDRSGDHGGDGTFETSSAMWIYSKSAELSIDHSSIPSGILQYTTFPQAPTSHRSIQQIDIVPTLSLLLGQRSMPRRRTPGARHLNLELGFAVEAYCWTRRVPARDGDGGGCRCAQSGTSMPSPPALRLSSNAAGYLVVGAAEGKINRERVHVVWKVREYLLLYPSHSLSSLF